jgi:hypothetical protein
MATGRLRTNCRAERMACLVCPGRHRRYDCIPNDLGIGGADSPGTNEYILTPRQPYLLSRNWSGWNCYNSDQDAFTSQQLPLHTRLLKPLYLLFSSAASVQRL